MFKTKKSRLEQELGTMFDEFVISVVRAELCKSIIFTETTVNDPKVNVIKVKPVKKVKKKYRRRRTYTARTDEVTQIVKDTEALEVYEVLRVPKRNWNVNQSPSQAMYQEGKRLGRKYTTRAKHGYYEIKRVK